MSRCLTLSPMDKGTPPGPKVKAATATVWSLPWNGQGKGTEHTNSARNGFPAAVRPSARNVQYKTKCYRNN